MLRLDAVDVIRTPRRRAADKAALSAQQPRQIVLILESRRVLVGEHIAGLALRRRRGPSEDLAEDDQEDFDLFVGGISRS